MKSSIQTYQTEARWHMQAKSWNLLISKGLDFPHEYYLTMNSGFVLVGSFGLVFWWWCFFVFNENVPSFVCGIWTELHTNSSGKTDWCHCFLKLEDPHAKQQTLRFSFVFSSKGNRWNFCQTCIICQSRTEDQSIARIFRDLYSTCTFTRIISCHILAA